MSKVILVTGASSGIGRRIASTLARNGHRVFGTSRRPQSDIMDGFEMLPLDVSADDSATECVEAVLQKAGRLDVLVNNAGIDLFGALEETSLPEAKALFETNFFGVARMVNAVLPHMRQQKSGLIINIGSIAGLTYAPFQGYYAATKHALEGYSAALRLELEPLGVRVALVEPGFFRSNIATNSLTPEQTIRDYKHPRQRAKRRAERNVNRGADPQPVADIVLQIVEGRDRRFRHVVGDFVARISIFSSASPERIVTAVVKRYTGLRPLRKDLPWVAAVLASFWIVYQIRSFFKRLTRREQHPNGN